MLRWRDTRAVGRTVFITANVQNSTFSVPRQYFFLYHIGYYDLVRRLAKTPTYLVMRHFLARDVICTTRAYA